MAAISDLASWVTTRYAPAGYIETSEDMSDPQVQRLQEAFRDYDPDKGVLVLPAGARFVPWAAYEPQAVLSETLEVEGYDAPIKWLAIGTIGNAIGILAIALALILR